MLDQYGHKTRNLVSTLFSLSFLILLALYAGYIEFFLDAKDQSSATTLLENPIAERVIKNTVSIRFRNRIGNYSIKKIQNKWVLEEPRVIPAKTETINNILNSLKNIRIHTVHEYEPINFQSFSLDKPIIEIDLFTKLNEKYNIKIGLMNPINNTSYLTVSGHNRIFQTNLFEGRLEKLELSDFIDSQVFAPKLANIKSFKLFHGNSATPYNHFENTNGVWSTKKYNVISNTNLEAKLQKLLDIKTHMIIDKKDDELSTFIDNYLKSPLYKIEIETLEGKKIEYQISTLIKAINELKLEKRQFFLMSASNRLHPYVINKSYLEEFQIRYDDLKP